MKIKIKNLEIKIGTILQNNILKDSIVLVTEVISDKICKGVHLTTGDGYSDTPNYKHADNLYKSSHVLFTGTITLQND